MSWHYLHNRVDTNCTYGINISTYEELSPLREIVQTKEEGADILLKVMLISKKRQDEERTEHRSERWVGIQKTDRQGWIHQGLRKITSILRREANDPRACNLYGKEDWEKIINDRMCSPHKWEKTRQQNGKFTINDEIRSFQDAWDNFCDFTEARKGWKICVNLRSSQELAGESLEDICSGGEQLPPLRSKTTHGVFYSKGKLTESYLDSLSGTMCKPSMDYPGAEKSTSLAEVSRAKILVVQEKAQELTETDRPCGHTWRESSVKFDLDTHSWKTHLCLWEEDLPESSVTLPKWGMMQNGECWERTTLPHLTSGTEFGLSLPTPVSTDATAGAVLNENTKLIQLKSGRLRKISNNGVSGSIGLARHVALWPTPRVGGTENAETVISRKGATAAAKHNLLAAVQMDNPTFPTPGTTGMSNGSGNCEKANKLHQAGVIDEETRRSMRAGNGGQLNPNWVEWLIGWPIGWTDLKPLEMDKFQQWQNSHGKL